MLRRAWKPLAATAVVAPAAGYYWFYNSDSSQTFDLPIRVRGADGKVEMSSKRLALATMKSIESRLYANATSYVQPRPGGLLWKHTTASLASNDPIEDANSHAIIQRDVSDPSAPGDLLFFSVMDGHGGYHTSQLLSKVLINAVSLELSSLITRHEIIPPKSSIMDNIKRVILPGSNSSSPVSLSDGNPEHVSLAIQNAFTQLDHELTSAPLRILAENIDEESRKNKTVPDLSRHPLALTSMLPAISGSCAIMAVVDVAHQNLYVACTGDCRAVAGVWEESEDGTAGWKAEVLSEDQTGRNPKELARMQSEHPADEASSVIMRGRVLGGLEPTRAFGDARYKWPKPIQEILSQAFLVGNGQPMRPTPSSFKTPPYVTATPVVTHRKLALPTTASTSTDSKSSLKFIVLATDGLWDALSSEEVVSLVGGHLAGLKGVVPKSELGSLVHTSVGTPTVEGKDKDKKNSSTGSWVFLDSDNVSVHLIRNAFGGGDEMELRQMMSIPAPYSRRYRDDVTVTVVWWEQGKEDDAKVSQVKAKL